MNITEDNVGSDPASAQGITYANWLLPVTMLATSFDYLETGLGKFMEDEVQF